MSDNKLMARGGRMPVKLNAGAFLPLVLIGQFSCVSKKSTTDAASSASSPLSAAAGVDSRAVSSNGALTQLEKLIFQGGLDVPKLEAGRGLLWFPFVWSPVLAQPEKDSGLSTIDNLIIREPKLILRNVNSKAEVLLNLREESGALESKMQSSTKDRGGQVRFYLPRISALAQGDYVIEGIRVELGVRGQSRGTVATMPFVNPFQTSAAKPLLVKVREGKVATVARVVQTTSIAEAAQGLSLKTVSENLDNDVVPVGVVVQHLAGKGQEFLSAITPATNDFPRLRVDLTNDKNELPSIDEPVAKVGFLVDAPCSAEGSIRIIWKRSNDDKEYLSQFQFVAGDASCKEKKSHGFVFAIPSGDWVPKSTLISSVKSNQAEVQTSWLRAPTSLLKDYFSLTQPKFSWTLETQREREIRRALIVPVESASRKHAELRKTRDVYSLGGATKSADVLFLGHFDIRVSSAKNERSEIWDFVLKSGYDLTQTRTLLVANEVFNAYTLEKLTSGRSNNSNIILRTAADQEDRPSVAPVAAELQGEAKKAYANCIKEREESDPLVSLGGMLRFTVLKGSDSVNIKSRRPNNDTVIENWLELCLKKKLIGFRFSKKAPVNFQGELKFGKEM